HRGSSIRRRYARDAVDVRQDPLPPAAAHPSGDRTGRQPGLERLRAPEHAELLGREPAQLAFVVALRSLFGRHPAMKARGCDRYPAASFSSRSWLTTFGFPWPSSARMTSPVMKPRFFLRT